VGEKTHASSSHPVTGDLLKREICDVYNDDPGHQDSRHILASRRLVYHLRTGKADAVTTEILVRANIIATERGILVPKNK
jgi:hypothetical protein